MQAKELQYRVIPCRKVVDITALVAIQYLDLPKDFIFTPEKHRCWEITFVDYGSFHSYADGKEFELCKQDMILYPPMVEHGILSKTEHTPNLVSFSFESDSPLLYRLSSRVIHLSAELQKTLSNILKYAYLLSDHALPINAADEILQSDCVDKDILLQLITLSLEEVLLFLLCDEHILPGTSRLAKTTTENQRNNLTDEIQHYIDTHLHEKLTLQNISRHFNISVGKLCRDVKATTDTSLQELIAQRRLKAAKRMIRREELNFTQISEQLGFSSLHYFSQWFKKQTHMSPTEYATSVKNRSEQ